MILFFVMLNIKLCYVFDTVAAVQRFMLYYVGVFVLGNLYVASYLLFGAFYEEIKRARRYNAYRPQKCRMRCFYVVVVLYMMTHLGMLYAFTLFYFTWACLKLILAEAIIGAICFTLWFIGRRCYWICSAGFRRAKRPTTYAELYRKYK